MEQIFCEHPVIILNPHFKNYLLKWKVYFVHNQMYTISEETYNKYLAYFPYSIFSPKRNNITLENLSDHYVYNQYTHEIIPMYIQVPCGKCVICRDKKAREWSFRAVCENATSEQQPIFVTLTYNNEHLPSCGIFKEELQLFLKRLRIRLTRLGYKHNLRYFACGEYGSKSGRPHYHMIIWNMPLMRNISERLHTIEKAWSLPTGKYNRDGSPITKQIGFAYALPCERGAITYVMKYMRKEPSIPNGKNPTFFLSSRKNGGIGAAYAKRYIDYYRIHSDQLDMSVLDPYSGQTFTMSIPQYYKRIFYPSLSQFVSKEIRDAHRKLCYHIAMRHTYFELLEMPMSPKLSPMERKVLKRFSFLTNNLGTSFIDDECRRLYKHDREFIRNQWQNNELEIDNYLRFLIRASYPATYAKERVEILTKRQVALRVKYGSLPQQDINDVKYNLINRIKLAQSKEIL